MLEELRSEVEQLVKQIEKVQKIEELFSNGNASFMDINQAVAEMLATSSIITELTLQYVEELGVRIRKERQKKNLEELGYGGT